MGAGLEVYVGIAAVVGDGATVGDGVTVERGRVAVGGIGVAVAKVSSAYGRTVPVSGGESTRSCHGVSIASVSIANVYPTPTATAKRANRKQIAISLDKMEPVDFEACSAFWGVECAGQPRGLPLRSTR